MLVHFGITPYLVFDGDYLPSKAGTEKERAKRRADSKRLGLELLSVGKTSQAHLELQKAVDVTPDMARMLIEELKHHNIQYIVAPYEADSQLAYLERKGIINGILSEDSDLLVFGAKCLITKLDKYGECVEVNRNHFTACREISLVGWTDADFRRMAILSGCDYLPGISGMGLKTAYRMLRKHKSVARVIKAAQFDGKFKVTAGYLQDFEQAEKTFLYQWVFCPLANQVVNLTPLESDHHLVDLPFIGEKVPSHLAFGVAQGELHPHTKQPLAAPANSAPKGKPLRPPRPAPAVSQTPAGKQSKPIDSFFQPKRTPLAELDVNLFTPSPSQQALLEQQRDSNGWESVPAPRMSSHAQPVHARTAPQPSRRAISDSVPARRSVSHPFKRQRLCSDPDLNNHGDADAEFTKSRFFTPSMAEPSPSIRTTKNQNSKSRSSFELFSDDSIEEAMAELTGLEHASHQPKKKMKVFLDGSGFSTNTNSQASTLSLGSTQISQESQESGVITPATSFGSPEPDSIFSRSLSKQVKSLRSRFSYDSTASPSSNTQPSRSASSRSIVPTKRVAPTNSFERERLEDQQAVTNDTCTHEDRNDNDLVEERSWTAMESQIVVAASDTEPMSPSQPTPPHMTEPKGSEDLLVPDSDAESICSPHKPLLNLARFAFSG